MSERRASDARVHRNWFERTIGDRMARLTRPSLVNELAVAGRRSGQVEHTPVVVLEHDGDRYLVSAFGHSDWTKNLEAARTATLRTRGPAEPVRAEPVPVAERPPLLDAYVRRFGKMPRVAAAFRELPDPADHPTFRLQE